MIGHAGLFSTAPDILTFLGVLLKGEYSYVSDGAQKGLGWQLDQPWFMGNTCGQRTFGKTGFTGTSCVIDMERGIAFVIFSNRTYPKRSPDAASLHSAINVFR
ncbi:MAG: serine hydrolase domain-containing protein, partial [Candidatus Diapherotrites archaeon]|nr:serine hydrolase domain-containing protein [Candidatus Diapherotrites archaeon]